MIKWHGIRDICEYVYRVSSHAHVVCIIIHGRDCTGDGDSRRQRKCDKKCRHGNFHRGKCADCVDPAEDASTRWGWPPRKIRAPSVDRAWTHLPGYPISYTTRALRRSNDFLLSPLWNPPSSSSDLTVVVNPQVVGFVDRNDLFSFLFVSTSQQHPFGDSPPHHLA
jgi:hypothetical protein